MSRSDSAGVSLIALETELLPECVLAETPELVIGGTETSDDIALYRVFDASRMNDGVIAIAHESESQVRFYDGTGRLIRMTGRFGQGPGEFRRVSRVWAAPGDTLIVGDYSPWRLSILAPNGHVVRTISFTPQYLSSDFLDIMNDGRILIANECCRSRSPSFERVTLYVMLHGPDGVLLDTIARLPSRRMGPQGPPSMRAFMMPLFEPRTVLASYDSGFVYGSGRYRELRLISPEGSLLAIVRWAGKEVRVTKAVVDQYRAWLLARAGSDPTSLAFVRWEVDDARPINSTLPTLSDLEVGRDHMIWIREYSLPWTSQAVLWFGISLDGRRGCRMFVPSRLEIYEFGSGYLIGEIEDELGVERIVVYNWSSPFH